MSAVTDFLASRRADFVSLHDLLEAMTKHGEGCTLAEAAATLAQIFKCEGLSNPWVSYEPTRGIETYQRPLKGKSIPDSLLAYVANHGEFEEEEDDIPF